MEQPTHGITLWQPWAELILRGQKGWEFRSWPLPRHWVGRVLALHAGVTCERDVSAFYGIPPGALPLGAIVGHVILSGPLPFRVLCGCAVPVSGGPAIAPEMSACPGLPRENPATGSATWWAWPIIEVERVEPYAARGRQGVWEIAAGPPEATQGADPCLPF